jgi:hypothetical protein
LASFALTFTSRLASWWTRPFGAGLDHRQRDAAAFFIDGENPDFDHIAHRNHFVWIADETVGQVAHMD